MQYLFGHFQGHFTQKQIYNYMRATLFGLLICHRIKPLIGDSMNWAHLCKSWFLS